MSAKRSTFTISMEHELHYKLAVMALVKRMFMNDKKASISQFVHEAVTEWLENHKEEVDEIIKINNENGWLKL